MAILADTYVLRVDLPFSEYWLPLVIGMGVGLCAISAGKLAFGRKKNPVFKPEERPPEKTVDRDPFTQGSASEQRKSLRRQGNPTAVHVALDGQKDQPQQAWVMDRSMGGLCLQGSQEYRPGTRLSVLPANAPAMTPWVELEVRTCRELKTGFEVGCQFIKTPNWSILLMFG
jgi:hypothetical protein